MEEDGNKVACLWNCGEYFPSIKEARIHQDIHRKIKEFPCSKCDLVFPYERLMKQHYEEKHSTKLEKIEKKRKMRERKGKEKFFISCNKNKSKD